LQAGLDVVGCIPVVGEIADGANAVVSLARGDYVGAGLSLVSMVPVVGDVIGKGGKVVKAGVKHSDDIVKIGRQLIKHEDDIIRAGKKLDKALDAGKQLAKHGDEALDAGKNVAKHGDEATETVVKKLKDEDLPVHKVNKSETPGIYDNTVKAQKDGQPSVLTRETNKKTIRKQRRSATKGKKAKKGQSIDEYPFASTKEGGQGATTATVPIGEQSQQGGQLSSFYKKNNIKEGDKFKVVPVDDTK